MMNTLFFVTKVTIPFHRINVSLQLLNYNNERETF